MGNSIKLAPHHHLYRKYVISGPYKWWCGAHFILFPIQMVVWSQFCTVSHTNGGVEPLLYCFPYKWWCGANFLLFPIQSVVWSHFYTIFHTNGGVEPILYYGPYKWWCGADFILWPIQMVVWSQVLTSLTERTVYDTRKGPSGPC